MNEPDSDLPTDERVQQMIDLAFADDPPPGHEARMLAAFEADDAKRARALRPRRVWPAVAVAFVALAAAAVLALHYRAQAHPVTTPGVEWHDDPATAVPPRHRGQ